MSDIPILCKVQALYPFRSNDSSSLSFNQDDLIDVLNKLPSGWWDGLCNGTRGWFPSNYVRIIASHTKQDQERMESPVKGKSEYRLSISYNDTDDTEYNENRLMPQQTNGDEPNVHLLNKMNRNMSESVVDIDSVYEFDQASSAGMPSWSDQSLLLSIDEEPQRSSRVTSRYSSNQSLHSFELNSPPSPSQLLTKSPSHRPPMRRINSDEPLSWIRVSSNIAIAIHQLTTVAKRNQCSLYHEYLDNVVDSIRFMLIASSTIDKESSYIKANGTLRSHHRAMMASMTKLILSVQTSHTSFSTADDQQTRAGKILSESDELLLMIRNFVNTCQSLKIPLTQVDPRWIDEKEKNCMLDRSSSRNSRSSNSSSGHCTKNLSNHSNRYTLQMNLAENLETMGACIQDSAEMIVKCVSKSLLGEHPSNDRSSLAALLFTHFRNLSNQVSVFLSYIDETDFSIVQQPFEMSNLQSGKQALANRLGLLFYKLQALTDESLMDFPACLKETELAAESLFDPIELICETVLHLASKNRSRTNSNASCSVTDNSNLAKKAPSSVIIDAAVIQEVDKEPDNKSGEGKDVLKSLKLKSTDEDGRRSAREIMECHKSELIPQSTMLPYPMRRSQTDPAAKQTSSNKLKKFFGDEAPLPETASAKLSARERFEYLLYDYGPNEIVFNEQGSVKGGTLPALVERLTLHDYLDMNFINTFLLTYRSFCTSMDLLDLLEARYNLQCPPGLPKEDIFIWEEKKLKLVRLRVFNVLKNWLESYYNEDDSALLDRLLQFTQSNIKKTLKFSNGQLESLIQRRRNSDTMDGHKKMILTLPAPPEPIFPKNRRRFKLLDIDSLEMARQLTIIDFRLYSAIRPIECLDKAWSRDEDGNVAINIRASIEYCNQITCWVSDIILSQHDIKKRSALIKYWVQVAEKCRDLNNFNTCMAILSAFDNSSVGRLKRTWEVVGTRTNQSLQQIRKLMGANRNFMEYRDLIHSINPPCIPFLGIYLQDLTFIEDGNANELKQSKDLINFAKRAKTAEVIREIQQFQSSLYQLKPVDEIQAYIKAFLKSTRDEEQLYKESLKLEPREREDEKITRLLQESGFL
ncbi:hypothetical protein [Parasitella parasitica]|uniref:Ras GEF n=1 Tax=Parasitella parasitica TaxID=35722 RepID=A0A0B7N289_9FUNG|nr:hypothetical protein [Parasitella parasitica]